MPTLFISTWSLNISCWLTSVFLFGMGILFEVDFTCENWSWTWNTEGENWNWTLFAALTMCICVWFDNEYGITCGEQVSVMTQRLTCDNSLIWWYQTWAAHIFRRLFSSVSYVNSAQITVYWARITFQCVCKSDKEEQIRERKSSIVFLMLGVLNWGMHSGVST